MDKTELAVSLSQHQPRFFGGPCAIENLDHCLRMAEIGKEIADRLVLNMFSKPVLMKIMDLRSIAFTELG